MNFSKLLAAGRCMVGIKDTASPYKVMKTSFLPKFESPKNPFNPQSKAQAIGIKSVAETASPAVASEAKVSSPSATTPTITPVVMETISLFDATVKPAAQPIPVVETAPAPAQPVEIKFEVKAPTPAPAPISAKVAAPKCDKAGDSMWSVKRPPSPRPSPPGEGETEPVGGLTFDPIAQPLQEIQTKCQAARPAVAKSTPLARLVAVVNPLAYLPGNKPKAAAKNLRQARPPVQTGLSLENVKVMRNDLNDTDLEVIHARPIPKVEEGGGGMAGVPNGASSGVAEPTALSRLTARFFGPGQTQTR